MGSIEAGFRRTALAGALLLAGANSAQAINAAGGGNLAASPTNATPSQMQPGQAAQPTQTIRPVAPIAAPVGPPKKADLVPILNGNHYLGFFGVRNTGNGPAGPSKLKLECRKVGATGGGSGCPEIPAAARARYSDPAFPNQIIVPIRDVGPGAGADVQLSFWSSLSWQPGDYQITLTADAANSVNEHNENNNTGAITYTVRPKPAEGTKPAEGKH